MSDKTTTAEDFDAIAPYPTNPDTATADALARNYAVLAQANFLRSLEGPTPEIRREGTSMMLGLYSVVHLLRAFSNTGPANATTRDLLEDLAAPHCIGPTIWGWLTEYGIDPARIDSLVSAMKEMRPQPETVSVRKDDLVAYLNRGPDMVRETVALGRLLKAAGIEK